MTEFNLGNYLTNGVETIVSGAIKATISNPRESFFLSKYAIDAKHAAAIRKKSDEKGEHIPPFLIASITSKCNLHCAGCYARANHSCTDTEADNQLTDKQWGKIFKEAGELGISFILLAGGEPFIRKDVITEAAKYQNIIFPVFTNGTMFNSDYIRLFDDNRNLIVILSIEGKKNATDKRRGEGIYEKSIQNMEMLNSRKILFGASVTVTKENMHEVMGEEFLDNLYKNGCKVVIYVEYVPVNEAAMEMALTDSERHIMEEKLRKLRNERTGMVFIAFPGDEKTSGGCLAAGRGFFHINSKGGAEPCPFSPYSDINVKEHSLKEALKSQLFSKIGAENLLLNDHVGGCVLFEQKDEVEKLLNGTD